MASLAEPRRLPLWLLLGVYIFPLFFAWFLLRPGFSRHVRTGAFLLAGMSLIVAVARWTSA